MAHFALVDKDGNVLDVLPVDNKDLQGLDYPYADDIGTEFLNNCGFPGRWIQTSYSNSFRKNCATVGGIYDEKIDAFYNLEKPHEECVWDEYNMRWVPPNNAVI